MHNVLRSANQLLFVIGKSGSIVVCISPLTSLMMDQCKKFNSKGLQAEFIQAEFIGEAQTDKGIIQNVIEGKVPLVFITPENIVENPKYRKMLQSPIYKSNIAALVVDEAHLRPIV